MPRRTGRGRVCGQNRDGQRFIGIEDHPSVIVQFPADGQTVDRLKLHDGLLRVGAKVAVDAIGIVSQLRQALLQTEHIGPDVGTFDAIGLRVFLIQRRLRGAVGHSGLGHVAGALEQHDGAGNGFVVLGPGHIGIQVSKIGQPLLEGDDGGVVVPQPEGGIYGQDDHIGRRLGRPRCGGRRRRLGDVGRRGERVRGGSRRRSRHRGTCVGQVTDGQNVSGDQGHEKK